MNVYELTAHYAVHYFGAIQHPDELAGLLQMLDVSLTIDPAQFVDGDPRNGLARDPRILEIGSDAGGTLYAWRNIWPNAKVIAVSLQEGPYATGRPTDPHGAEWVQGDSHELDTFEKVLKVLDGELVDFLMIDGDHSRAGCADDIASYGELVRPGGWMALHDISKHSRPEPVCEVDQVWAGLTDDDEPDWNEWTDPHTFTTQMPPRDANDDPIIWGGIGAVRRRIG